MQRWGERLLDSRGEFVSLYGRILSRRPSRLTNDAEKAIAVKALAMRTALVRGACVSTWTTMILEISRSERKTNVVPTSNRCATFNRSLPEKKEINFT